ncbi:MAG: GTPase Era [Gammaproteobacteria bacterium]|nr:GTPase Era [Gammaproteobacteria bacterium]MCI0590944.1 GTPase Era [Gammaproteobacteria bacterium]
MSASPDDHCGYVAIVGRPNVGKSTLLNRLIGQKISITSRKPQTTRYPILAIKTVGRRQAIYVDTPGLQKSPRRAINRFMNREVYNAIEGVDLIVMMVEALFWTEEDDFLVAQLDKHPVPIILAVNKVDKLKDKSKLLPYLDKFGQMMAYIDVFPISARKGDNLESLEQRILSLLPHGPLCYAVDQMTDRSQRFFAAELIREKLMRMLGAEVPYHLSVVIDEFSHQGAVVQIMATIWVERPGQKAIVIGKNGRLLKEVGEQARKDMEKMFGSKVFLRTWVKVKEKWSNDIRALQELGYHMQGRVVDIPE